MGSSDLLFGVHTGPSNVGVGELVDLWRRIEEGPFGWISVWDHLYAADGVGTHNLEAVAMHTALAMTTTRVRCGALVYCAGFRHPAVLAKAMSTIDHLSGGRCEFGIGAGWARFEYDAYGFAWAGARERLDLMEESTRCVRGLLREERFDFEGTYFSLADAHNDPRPLQAELPIWVGGVGERRTLRIAAEVADGWNAPYLSPAEFARKREVLHAHCAAVGRDPGEIRCAVNVAFAPDEESLRQQFGMTADVVRDGALRGSDTRIAERIDEYAAAGVDQVNFALRAPYDPAVVDRLAGIVSSR